MIANYFAKCLTISIISLAVCGTQLLGNDDSNIPTTQKIISLYNDDAQTKEPLPQLDANSTLPDYLNYAALNNPGLEASFNRFKAALEQIPQAKALPDPEIKYGSYTRQPDMQMSQMAGIMQKFPWLGKIEAQTNVAYANAEAARQEFESEKLRLYQDVKKEFYEFLYLKDAIDIARQNLELIKYFEQVAAAKYTSATGTHPDIIRAQIELVKLDEVLVSLRELKKPQAAKLNALLNRPVTDELDWPQKPQFSSPDTDLALLVNLLKQKNPQLAGLEWAIESAKNEVKLAKKKSYPDVAVGVEWTEFEKSGDNSGRDSVALVFQMNLPIWQESYKAAERQAKANVRNAIRQKKDTENTLAAEVAAVLYDLEESQRKIDLYNIIIPKAQQLVKASETAYKAGTVDFLSLIDAQRMLLQYNLEQQRSLTDNRRKLAELEALVGTEIPLK